ncbi:hypothetical protein [Microcoleus sp. S13C4]|uniref:hypothetical protein n=1 Tax=Microcoleus sp. S13C4 TaxID=3055410 RepID=UPI002FD4D29D
MNLDPRKFSQEAYTALTDLKDELEIFNLERDNLRDKHHKKASGLIQGLTAYISTWGLHRLSGDMRKFEAGTAEDTIYKGKVYRKFLVKLQTFSGADFDVNQEGTLIHLPLRNYTALNRLAIQLAKEWSFWAPAVLGEAEEV